jgi:ketosteroid isomerase-like protein
MPAKAGDVVRELFEGFRRSDMDYLLEHLDPAVEWHENPRGGFTDLRPLYRGHDGFRTWWRQTGEMWEELRPEVEEITEATGGKALVAYRLHARGRGSKVPVLSPTVHDLDTVREGKVVERRLYPVRREALEAAGVEEDPGSE